MAIANGPAAGSLGRWWARVDAQVVSETSTTATIRCRAYFHSNAWGFDVAGSGTASVDGNAVSSGRVNLYSPTGGTVDQLLASRELTVAKGSQPRTVWCSATVSVTGGSGLSKTATRRFRTHWAEPATPEVSLSYDAALACHVKAGNGVSSYEIEQTTLVGPVSADEANGELPMSGTFTVDGDAIVIGNAPRCSSFTVERVAYGGIAVIASGMLDSQETIDRIPPLNTDYAYRVTGYADNGTSSQATAEANVFAHGMALNFGQDASTALVLDYNGDYSTSSKRAVETYHFADGGENGDLPMSYALDELDKETSLSWEMGRDGHDAYMRIMDEQWKGWWRGHAGERAYGPMDFDMSVKAPGVWKGSASVVHNVFEEPING